VTGRRGIRRRQLLDDLKKKIKSQQLKLGYFKKVDQKYLGSFEMWCWRRMEKISWTDRVRNEEVLLRVKEERNVLRTVKRRKDNWIGHILCTNSLLKHVTEVKREGRITVTVRRGIRRKQLLDDLKERRGCWKLKEEALDRTVWRTGFGRSCGPFVRLLNGFIYLYIYEYVYIYSLFL
jgi:hypothetical protein